MMDGTAEPC